MTDDFKAKLSALLKAHADQVAKRPSDKPPSDQTDRRACGEQLHSVVRPVLEAIMTELRNAGHEASSANTSSATTPTPASLSPSHRAAGSLGAHLPL